MTRCSRCGMCFERLTVAQTRCVPCQRWTDQQVAADAARRTPRFPQAKDLTGMTGTVL